MKKLVGLALVLGSVLAAAPPVAQAKCFGFRDSDVRVCVPGNDNAARRRASEVCEEVTGSSCSVSGYSGECRRSGSTRCYDAAGTEQRQIESD
ncbi:MAG: hypothetical protein U0230_09285 [Polyangiales bacterium]